MLALVRFPRVSQIDLPMSEKELLAGLPPFLFAAAAMVSFVLAVYLVLHDKVAGASMLAAVAFLSALLAYLPQLESVSAFAVNVKLRSSLDRADEILNKLKAQSVVNAKLAYTTLAWGNRLGAPKAVDKQKVLDDVDEQLATLNVSSDEREEIKRTYLRFIGLDFVTLYVRAIDYGFNRKNEELQAKFQKDPSDPNRTALQTFTVKMSDWRSAAFRYSLEQIPMGGFRAYLHEKTPADAFSSDETKALHEMADRIADHFEASRRKGGYTAEAAKFYDDYFQDGVGVGIYRDVFKPKSN